MRKVYPCIGPAGSLNVGVQGVSLLGRYDHFAAIDRLAWW